MGYFYRKMISLILHSEIVRQIRPLLQIQPSLTVSIFLDPPVLSLLLISLTVDSVALDSCRTFCKTSDFLDVLYYLRLRPWPEPFFLYFRYLTKEISMRRHICNKNLSHKPYLSTNFSLSFKIKSFILSLNPVIQRFILCINLKPLSLLFVFVSLVAKKPKRILKKIV